MISKQVFVHAAIQAIAWIVGTAAFAQQPFTIRGSLARDRQGMVRLIHFSPHGRQVQDSATVTNGVFVLTGKVAESGMAQLILSS